MDKETEEKCFSITKKKLDSIFEQYDEDDILYDPVHINGREYVRVYCSGRKKANDPKSIGSARIYVDVKREDIYKEDYHFRD